METETRSHKVVLLLHFHLILLLSIEKNLIRELRQLRQPKFQRRQSRIIREAERTRRKKVQHFHLMLILSIEKHLMRRNKELMHIHKG